MRKSCALLLALLTPLAAEVSLGHYYTAEGSAITFIATPWSNRPLGNFLVGMQVPAELLKEGVLVSVQCASRETAAYQIALTYRSGEGEITTTTTLQRSGLWTSALFEIGAVPVVSISVTELAVKSTLRIRGGE